MKTREQEYAAKVYKWVYEIWSEDASYQKKYGAMAHKLPILVRTAGLAQALAFAETRKGPQKKLLDHLELVVLGEGSQESLEAKSRDLSLLEYMRLTDDVMLALTWFKRFAQSVLGVDSSEDLEEGGNSDE